MNVVEACTKKSVQQLMIPGGSGKRGRMGREMENEGW